MTSTAAMHERVHIMSDTDGPARETRQGLSRKAKVLAACGVLLAVAVAGWQMQRQWTRRTPGSSNSGASHFLADKSEDKTGDKAEDESEKQVFDEAFGRSVLDKADLNYNNTWNMKQKAEDDKKNAEELERTSKEAIPEAENRVKASIDQLTKIGKAFDKSHRLASKAKSKIARAEKARDNAADDIQASKDIIAKAKDDVKSAQQMMAKAVLLEEGLQEKKDKAAVVEQEAMDKTAEGRVCVDLPGVQLASAGGKDGFDPIAVDKNADTPEACSLWCRQHDGCAQATFNSRSKSCQLFKETTTKAKSYRDGVNSFYCGKAGDKKKMKGLVKKAMSHQP